MHQESPNAASEFSPEAFTVNTSDVLIEDSSPLNSFPADLFTGVTFAIYVNHFFTFCKLIF